MRKVLKTCWKHFRAYWFSLFVLITLSLLSSVFSTLCPYVLGSLFDLLISSTDSKILLQECFLYLVLSVGTLAVGYLTNLIRVKLHTKSSFSLNASIISHLHSVPFNKIFSIDPIYYTQRINNDSTQVMSFFIEITVGTILHLLCIVAPMIIVAMIYPLLIVYITVIILSYILSYVIVRKKLYTASFSFKESQAAFFGKLGQQLSYIKLIKLFGIKDFMEKSLNQSFLYVFRNAVEYQKKGYLFSSLDSLIATISQVCFLFIGGFLVFSKKITIGQMTIVISYLSLCLSSIRYFFSMGKQYQDAKTAIDRIDEIQTISHERYGSCKLKTVNEICVKNLSASLGDKNIFDNFNGTFVKGKLYGITGKNGAGKTTLINILSGLYQGCYTGSVKIDNVELLDFSEQFLHENLISVCTQEPNILSESLRDNILFGANETKKLSEIVTLLNLDSLVQTLPNGFSTVLDTKGIKLSGGESQKISIARTLIRDTPILILDEPTSSMDVETKMAFLNYLRNILSKKIIIIVTHDNFVIPYLDAKYTLEGFIDEQQGS